MDQRYERARTGSKFKPGSVEAQKMYWDHYSDRDLLQADLDEIESRKAIERARHWGVPIPQRIYKEMETNDDWDWSSVHYRHYLSEKAKMILRRECAAEIDIYYKPWATWIAVIISFVALLVAVFKP
ncbi:hypothetical protein RMR21_006245 [Agrobacterium sp. rho-8.1]|nr:hypothetical protein [Agrobacterium sp. rho-8.1]